MAERLGIRARLKTVSNWFIRSSFVVIVCSVPLGAQAQSFYYSGYYGNSTSTPSSAQWRSDGEARQHIAALPAEIARSIPIPILFGVTPQSIAPNFGDPRSGGRLHEGEDMLAPKGTPVVSPVDAVVTRTTNGASSGLTVYTQGPGGERYVYMHLDRFGEGVTQGAVLSPGSLIGYVGDSGNAAGGPAHLHFEIQQSGQPIDPYPRLTEEFSIADKMRYLTTILHQATDPAGLAAFLVREFGAVFEYARTAGIALPAPIEALRDTSRAPVALGEGATGAEVVSLQRMLIQAARGPAAAQLAGAGATGYFGPLTAAALAEYERGSVAEASTPVNVIIPTVPAQDTGLSLARNLSLGTSGEDVRALQRFLNAAGYIVAHSGAGSPGNETAYFGPATLTAVMRYQAVNGIVPAAGYVGPITRAALLRTV